MAEDLTEIGVTGLRHSFGRIQEELLVHLKGKRGLRTFREMNDNDPVVGSIMYLMKILMRRVPWIARPSDPENDEAVKWATFLQGQTIDMSMTWPDFLTDALSMTYAGYSVHEVVLKERGGRNRDPKKRSRFSDGLIGLRKLAIRGQETIDQWDIDPDDGGLRGFWQINPNIGAGKARRIFIPMTKAVLFRTESNKNNPEGRSLLRNAYRPWYFKKRIEEIEAIGVERDLTGLPVMQVPRRLLSRTASANDVALREELKKAMALLRRDALEYAMVPSEWEDNGQNGERHSGYKLELLTTGGRRQIPTNDIIGRYDSRIAMTLIADLVLMGMQKVGTFSMFTGKANLVTMALESLLEQVREPINRFVVPTLMEVNGVDEDLWPHFVNGPVQAPPMDELGGFLSKLTSGNPAVITPGPELEKFVRDMYRMPEEDSGLRDRVTQSRTDAANAATEEREAREQEDDQEVIDAIAAVAKLKAESEE